MERSIFCQNILTFLLLQVFKVLPKGRTRLSHVVYCVRIVEIYIGKLSVIVQQVEVLQ